MKQKRTTRSGPAFDKTAVDPKVAFNKLAALTDKISQLKGQTAISPEYGAWASDVRIALTKFYGEDSEEYVRFKGIWFTPGVSYPGQPDSEIVEAFDRGLEEARLFLISRKEDWNAELAPSLKSAPKVPVNRKNVFLIHGHNHGIKETVARFLSKLGLTPIILHEQADQGRTIIEKFEQHANVSFAVAIFSGDDLGTSKAEISESTTIEQSIHPRPRQNVVFEFGYFVGTLGRKNVVAIVETGVETMSDNSGVLYIPFDPEDGWRLRLVKELKAAGLDVDANAAF
jgi:predicted nucleotide-binding protein